MRHELRAPLAAVARAPGTGTGTGTGTGAGRENRRCAAFLSTLLGATPRPHPVDSPGMNVSGPSRPDPGAYAVRVARVAQDQQKQEGEQAVALIEQAAAPAPRRPGALIDVIA
jgi:hypothetical protein